MCPGHYEAEVLSLFDIKIVRAVIAMRGQGSNGLSFPCFPKAGWQSHHPRLTPPGASPKSGSEIQKKGRAVCLASLGALGPAICGHSCKYSGTS